MQLCIALAIVFGLLQEDNTVDRIHEELGLELAKDEEEEEEEELEDDPDAQRAEGALPSSIPSLDLLF